MKKVLKILVVVIVLGFIAIQFSRPERTNPQTIDAEKLEASTNLPENIKLILKRSCNDCHSNETNWIWYSNVAPISWGMTDHVRVGREKLNFSKWQIYSKDRKIHKLEEICEQIEIGEMPHYQYLWLHWDARISPEQISELCSWTLIESEKLNSHND